MRINNKQKLTALIGVGFMVLLGLYPPWVQSTSFRGIMMNKPVYGWLFSPPSHDLVKTSVDVTRLIVQWLVAAIATIGIVFLFAKRNNTTNKEIRAERFIITGASGETKAIFGAPTDGAPFITLLDANGKMRFHLSVSDVPSMNFYDGKGNNRVAIAVAHDGDPNMAFFYDEKYTKGNNENLCLEIGIKNGGPNIIQFNKEGDVRIGIGLDADGDPNINILDGNGVLWKIP